MNDPQFVFGYGSLVAEHDRGHVARLCGWRRTWGVAMDNSRDLPGYKSYRLADGRRPVVFVAFIDIEPDPVAAVTGVCMPVDPADLHALDARERNYDRIDVTGAIDAAPGLVWAYRGSDAGRARLREGLAGGRAVVHREYLDGVLAGVAAIAPEEVAELERSPSVAGLRVLALERVEIPREPGVAAPVVHDLRMARHSGSTRLVATPRSRAIGVLAATGAVAATTLLIYPLREVAPALSTRVVYLVAVLLVSIYHGRTLGLLTAVGSAAAFNFFHIPPTGRFAIADSTDWVGLGVYLVAAIIASGLADRARGQAAEAEQRRREADLTAATARVLLGEATLADALPETSRLIGRALGLHDVEIVLEPAASGGIALDLGAGREATLVPGADAGEQAIARLHDRVAPSLEALLRAALDRERLQAEVVETQALRRSDVIKTTLLRAVSHDLRSPLTAILTAGEAVRSPALADAERDELGLVVVEEAHRLSALVDKLLDLSKLQSGAAEPRRDWCSLEEIIRTAADEVGSAGPGFVLSFDDDLPLVQADAAQLERAFVNVLENARRFSGGHPVKVRARVVGGRMIIRVIDRGPGMSAAQLARAFEAFWRSEPAGEHAGSGLGLAIVRGFVEANGGHVHAESLPGQGTVIVVELPLSEQPAAATAARP